MVVYIMMFAWLANLVSWRFDLPIWLEFKQRYLNYKVFNCSTCTGFYISIPFNIIFIHDIFLNLAIPFVISYIASLMEKQLNMFND